MDDEYQVVLGLKHALDRAEHAFGTVQLLVPSNVRAAIAAFQTAMEESNLPFNDQDPNFKEIALEWGATVDTTINGRVLHFKHWSLYTAYINHGQSSMYEYSISPR